MTPEQKPLCQCKRISDSDREIARSYAQAYLTGTFANPNIRTDYGHTGDSAMKWAERMLQAEWDAYGQRGR